MSVSLLSWVRFEGSHEYAGTGLGELPNGSLGSQGWLPEKEHAWELCGVS